MYIPLEVRVSSEKMGYNSCTEELRVTRDNKEGENLTRKISRLKHQIPKGQAGASLVSGQAQADREPVELMGNTFPINSTDPSLGNPDAEEGRDGSDSRVALIDPTERLLPEELSAYEVEELAPQSVKATLIDPNQNQDADKVIDHWLAPREEREPDVDMKTMLVDPDSGTIARRLKRKQQAIDDKKLDPLVTPALHDKPLDSEERALVIDELQPEDQVKERPVPNANLFTRSNLTVNIDRYKI